MSGKGIYQLMPMQKYSSFKTSFFFHAKLLFTNLKGNEFMDATPVVLFLHGHFFYLWMGAQWRQDVKACIC